MKKTLCRVLLMLIIFAVAVLIVFCGKRDLASVSCVDNRPAQKMALCVTLENELETEDMVMYFVYQLARRNIVKVTAKDSAGSGIIWKIDKDIIIVSNKHLLMKDVKAKITFCDGEVTTGEVIGYSQQYDIGFVKVAEQDITGKLLRDIYEVVPVDYQLSADDDNSETKIVQVGVDNNSSVLDYYTGSIKEVAFQPLFNTDVIVTNCYAKAGMSGGGLFDNQGRLIGMVSGGDVSKTSKKKEADVTYSLPVSLIVEAYNQITYDIK